MDHIHFNKLYTTYPDLEPIFKNKLDTLLKKIEIISQYKIDGIEETMQQINKTVALQIDLVDMAYQIQSFDLIPEMTSIIDKMSIFIEKQSEKYLENIILEQKNQINVLKEKFHK